MAVMTTIQSPLEMSRAPAGVHRSSVLDDDDEEEDTAGKADVGLALAAAVTKWCSLIVQGHSHVIPTAARRLPWQIGER